MRYILSDALTWRNAMTRTILALALVAFLAGCDTTDSSAPSGAEAPRLTVTVLTGTKVAPVDSPKVRIAWEHESAVNIGVAAKNGFDSILGYPAIIYNKLSGDTVLVIPCIDSAKVIALVSIQPKQNANGSWDSARKIDDSKKVYCK